MYIIWFVIGYTAIILISMLSHVVLADYLKNYDRNVERKTKYWTTLLDKCKKNESYILKRKQMRKLVKPQFLSAFYEIQQSRMEEVGCLLSQNDTKIIRLMKRRTSTIKAYFAYVLSSFSLKEKEVLLRYADVMIDFALEDSVYLRENALKVLYKAGDAEYVSKAFKKLSEKYIYHSEKLIADGLMTFTGDDNCLATILSEQIFEYLECYQTSIVNYISYENIPNRTDRVERLLELTPSTDLKCAILRFFGKRAEERNKRILLRNVKLEKDENNWETAAVAAKMLGIYKNDPDVIKALKQSILAKNWYVRINSAESLTNICDSDSDLKSVLDGKDKYAIDALVYALEKKGENTNA